jgi:hypothetical protein
MSTDKPNCGSNIDYPEEIRAYSKSGCPFNSKTDRRKYDHWFYYKIKKPRKANKIQENKQ